MSNKPILICMRLANMKRVHPQMVTGLCTLCDNAVGIYPSGQRVLKIVDVEIVCEVCRPKADILILAPGAEKEGSESVTRQ